MVDMDYLYEMHRDLMLENKLEELQNMNAQEIIDSVDEKPDYYEMFYS